MSGFHSLSNVFKLISKHKFSAKKNFPRVALLSAGLNSGYRLNILKSLEFMQINVDKKNVFAKQLTKFSVLQSVFDPGYHKILRFMKFWDLRKSSQFFQILIFTLITISWYSLGSIGSILIKIRSYFTCDDRNANKMSNVWS